jgi:PTS system sucrose-specific IIC component
MGAVYPLAVVSGIHHMYNVIEAGMLAVEGGLNIWMPIASAANFAQGAACLAVGLKSRNAKTKAIAIPSAMSAALGITEPAIFGINLRMMKPLLCGIAGGAAGSLVGALLHVGAKGYGVTGIPGYLITMDYALQYTLVLAVSFVVAFGLTWLLWHEDENKK